MADDDRDAGARRHSRRPPGFIGKFYLIEAAVDGDYAWLGVVIVIGSMISLAYYLRVVAAVWMRPPTAGATPRRGPARRARRRRRGARRARPGACDRRVRFGAATIVLGIVPAPLFNLAGRRRMPVLVGQSSPAAAVTSA